MSAATFVQWAALLGLLVGLPSIFARLVVVTFGLRCEGHGCCETCGARAWQCDCDDGR